MSTDVTMSPTNVTMPQCQDHHFILSPEMSNVIFLIGVSLSGLGLLLITVAAIMMHKADNNRRKDAKLYQVNNTSVINGKPSNAGTDLTDITENEAEQNVPVAMEANTEGRVQGHSNETGNHTHHNTAAHAQIQLTNAPQEEMRYDNYPEGVDYTVVVRSPRLSPPQVCTGAGPYACNPIPDPEATRHYDQGYDFRPNYENTWHPGNRDDDMTPPPPPKSSPPLIPNEGEVSAYQYDQYRANSPYPAEYTYNAPSTPVVPPRVPNHSRTSSLSSAGQLHQLQSPTNQMFPSFPVSREGSLRMTYM